jgi:hypothetical protein
MRARPGKRRTIRVHTHMGSASHVAWCRRSLCCRLEVECARVCTRLGDAEVFLLTATRSYSSFIVWLSPISSTLQMTPFGIFTVISSGFQYFSVAAGAGDGDATSCRQRGAAGRRRRAGRSGERRRGRVRGGSSYSVYESLRKRVS